MEQSHGSITNLTPQLIDRNARVPEDPFQALSHARIFCGASDQGTKVCPLCDFDGTDRESNPSRTTDDLGDRNAEATMKRTRDHVANHLERIALLSLPVHNGFDFLSSMEAQSRQSPNERSFSEYSLPFQEKPIFLDNDLDDPNPCKSEQESDDPPGGSQVDWTEVLAVTRMRHPAYLQPEIDPLLLEFHAKSPFTGLAKSDRDAIREKLISISPENLLHAINILRLSVYCRRPVLQQDLATIAAIVPRGSTLR